MASTDPGPGGQPGDVFVPATVGGFGAAFPITRASDLLGSHRTVDTVVERDAISAAHRDEGMTVWITTTQEQYRLVGGILNTNWVLDYSSGAVPPLIRTYTPGVLVRDPVYQMASGLVDRADASAVATGAVLGIVAALDVPNVGDCTIIPLGEVTGFAGLTPGLLYILGTAPGSIVAVTDTGNPNYPSAVGEVIQEIGSGGAVATTMFVDCTRPLVEL